jgi:hypothetical protein
MAVLSYVDLGSDSMASCMFRTIKAKAVPLHAMEAFWGEGYSSYSFSTSALDGGEWSASHPGRALPPGKGPAVPIVQEAGWAPEPVWTQRIEEKSFCLCRGSNLDRLVVQSATPAPICHSIPSSNAMEIQRKYSHLLWGK